VNGSLRCLVLAPTGDDAALIAEALSAAGFAPQPQACVQDLCAAIPEGAGAVIVAAEAVDEQAALEIAATLDGDPVWSVLPFIMLTSADGRFDLDASLVDLFGPRARVSVIERPCRAAALTSAVRAALHARAHQYEVASLLARLDQQAQELERSNRDLHRFAFAASHDLQEPLRTITSYLDLIQQRNAERFDERTRHFFKYVIDGAGRMRALIGALLEYGKVGEAKARMATFPAEEVVGEALRNLAATIEDARAVVTTGPLPAICADRALLAVLFQNLVGNAIKYRTADPRVEITATESPTEWVFTVADNGIGIAPADQERIFDVFQRLHTSDHYKGNGIGLATCRRIVDLHGGRIWVESTSGAGSRFHVGIPRSG
jgi:signal transduction histidine kinase